MGSVFLERNWEQDERKIKQAFDALKQRNLPFWLVSFPEGTRLTDQKLKQSHDWAKKKDLPFLNHVLSPRTKGFVATIKGMRDCPNLNALYDFTVVYQHGKVITPWFSDYVLRNGGTVHVHMRRWKIETLPTNEAELEKFCNQIWLEKDKLIETLMKTGSFPNEKSLPYERIHPDIWPNVKT